MRSLLTIPVLAFWATAATANILPITHSYCSTSPASAGVRIDANGVWSEDSAPFDKILQHGPGWWVVTYKGEFNTGITARVSLSRDKQTITVTDSDSTDPIILHRCPS